MRKASVVLDEPLQPLDSHRRYSKGNKNEVDHRLPSLSRRNSYTSQNDGDGHALSRSNSTSSSQYIHQVFNKSNRSPSVTSPQVSSRVDHKTSKESNHDDKILSKHKHDHSACFAPHSSDAADVTGLAGTTNSNSYMVLSICCVGFQLPNNESFWNAGFGTSASKNEEISAEPDVTKNVTKEAASLQGIKVRYHHTGSMPTASFNPHKPIDEQIPYLNIDTTLGSCLAACVSFNRQVNPCFSCFRSQAVE